MLLSIRSLIFTVTLFASALGGCVIVSSDDGDVARKPVLTRPAAPAATLGPVRPMLVRVDTGKTMVAAGGDGAGVFVEYQTGGHWHISWTCDSLRTGETCSFFHRVDGASSELTGLQSLSATQTGPSRIESSSTVAGAVAEMFFDTAPGAIISLQSELAGVDTSDGKLFFFGRLTNPLQFQGTEP
jgi:hypothetical protein